MRTEARGQNLPVSLFLSHPYFFHLRLIKEEQSLHLCPPSSHTLLMHHYEALASPHSHPFPGLSGLCCSSVDTLLLSSLHVAPQPLSFFPANVFSHILPLPLTSASSWSFWCDGTGCRFNHRRGFTNKVNELKLHTAWRMVGGAGKQHVRCFQACSDFISVRGCFKQCWGSATMLLLMTFSHCYTYKCCMMDGHEMAQWFEKRCC